EPKEHTYTGTSGRTPLQKKPDIAEWFYVPSWKRSAIPDVSMARVQKRRCLVFSNGGWVGSEVIKSLHELGHEVYVIIKGKEFFQQDQQHYQINP
ncbi:hypothetical protein GWO43_14865, partial [candidate division KSB1 bacterium]|nr:hypothetical protein [candidate division KSB1 bacterium]NIS25218.1 hypothetical protein [candidate division KSB1 bacterium]NIT72126.1 hypothetical protein [candidate division KSB1 bacterium]NIU28680.1 hypothetical protein [candidate division KSB1 bacterium]NIU94437.1 hypothetical protein [candidate division KSB1 bacterium]